MSRVLSPKKTKRTKTLRHTKTKRKPKRLKSFDFSKVFIALFVLVMVVWAATMIFVSLPDKIQTTQNPDKIHEQLEIKKKRTSVLDKNAGIPKNANVGIPKDNNAGIPKNAKAGIPKEVGIPKDNNAGIPNNLDDESLKDFGKRLQDEINALKQEPKEQNEQTEYSYTPHTNFKSHKQAKPAKPKLAIIMDDISSAAQAKSIKELGLKITPSIFPPESAHPTSHELAKIFPVYMVHLPLQALNYKNEKDATLKVGATKEQIEQRIKNIKKSFKDVKFINNHTGSGFTSDYKSSLYLLESLKAQNIAFIDSLTTAKSQIPNAASKVGVKYAYRDVFLDNEQNTAKILQALANSVSIAKKDGIAIAICHPYKSTFEALRKAQNNGTLAGVEVVYVDKIYEYYK